MAVSDAILKRLLQLHPKIIDLTLDRMWRLLARLDHPEQKLPPVIHVAGTNGKGSTIAYLRAIMEQAGLGVHVYNSPHLVKFHERIRLAQSDGPSRLIDEDDLSALLEECEAANDGEQITFFEITTAAAILAYSRSNADYLLLEVGLGGRLDATNVIAKPALSIITSIALDHQQYLGETIEEIAGEKAGILKRSVGAVLAPQSDVVRQVIESKAQALPAPLAIAGQDWQAYEQHGRLVFQDGDGLMDLPMPALAGRFQIDNAGTAIAAIRQLRDPRINDAAVAQGLQNVQWGARLQKLAPGKLHELVRSDVDIWLDGGHNPAAGMAIAQSFADFNDHVPAPLTLIVGQLNSKKVGEYLRPFAGLVEQVITLTIPDEENAIDGDELADIARHVGLEAQTASDIEDAVRKASVGANPARVLIGGSLYLAGHVLALHFGAQASKISGTSRKV